MHQYRPIKQLSVIFTLLLVFSSLILVPSKLPVAAQSNTTTIESDDPSVAQEGTWTSQATSQASGGSYLYSSGSSDDVLSLEFEGSAIEIVYLEHPSFGSFAIDIDNNIRRTVVATGESTTFGNRAAVNYLSDGPHTLRLYAVEGAIAIDAFEMIPAQIASAQVTENGPIENYHTDPSISAFRIFADDGTIGQWFGRSIDIDGDTMVVGAPGDETSVQVAGAAYVFVWDGSAWNQQAKLTAAGEAFIGDHFAYDVAIQGDTIVVGAPNIDQISEDDDDIGAAYVFTRSGSTWTQQAKLVDTTREPNDKFGRSVAIDGNTIVVGSTGESAVALSNGEVVVFTGSGASWTLEQEIVPSQSMNVRVCGRSVAIDGDTLIMGCQSLGTEVFTRTAGVWSFQQLLVPTPATPEPSYYSFGISVDLDGDTAIIGMPSNSEAGRDAGAAYVFTRSGSTWSQQDKLEDFASGHTYELGYSVSVQGDLAVVTSPYSSGGGPPDQAYLFEYNAGSWPIRYQLPNHTLLSGDYYGFDNAMDGDVIAIGAPFDDTLGSQAGAVFIIYPYYAPTDLDATTASHDQIDLAWTDTIIGEDGYQIWRSPDGTNNWTQVGTTGPNATTFEDLTVACTTTYYYRVRGFYQTLNFPPQTVTSEYSGIDNDTTENCPPIAPSNLSAEALLNDDIELNWTDNSSDETEFQIERSLANAASWSLIAQVSANVTTLTDTDASLVCDETYDYRMRAYRSGDNKYSMYSNTVQVINYCAPEAPFDLTVTNAGETSITIGWTDIATNETDYYVERSRDNSNWSQIAALGADVESYQDTNLGCETTYYYRVRPYRSDIDVYSEEYSNTVNTSTTTCVTPGLMKLNSPVGTIAAEKPTFNWNESAQTTWYNLRVQKNGVTAFTQWYEGINICNAGTCVVTIGTALATGNYTWSVQGYGTAYGVGPWNTELNFSVVAPNQTAPVNTTLNSQSAPTFTWGKLTDLTWYYIYLSGPSGYLHTQWYDSSNCTANVCSITLPSPLPSMGNYIWYMRGWGPNGYSPWTGGATFTNSPAPPNAPDGLNIEFGAAGNPTKFEWNEDTNITWYNVIITKSGGTTLLNQWYQKGNSAMICDAGICSISPSLSFTNGAHSLTVSAYAAGGTTASSPSNFTVTILSPDIPDNFQVAMTNGLPTTYSWDDDDKATWFNVYIAGQSGVIHNVWYEKGNSTMICDVGTCSISPTLSYTNGNYGWWVQAFGPGGGTWSPENAFSVNIAVPNAPTNLQATIVNGVPTSFSWDDDNTATYFNLNIFGPSGVIHNSWYQKGNSAMTCLSNTCSVSPTISYTNGEYGWYVKAYGIGGLGPESGEEMFNINELAPDVPSGLDETFTDGFPTSYQWDDDENADLFSVYITGPGGVLLYQTYPKSGSDITCNATICTLSPTLSYVNGNYTWYVQAISPGGNFWSGGENFVVDIAKPDIPTDLDVTFTDVFPTTFAWSNDVKATWFNVYINGPGGVILNAWYQKGDSALTCDVDNCSISPSLSYVNGGYTWYVQAYGPGGGTWSGPDNFSVNVPAPAAPNLITPNADAVVTSTAVQFQWSEVTYGSWYQLEFRNSAGTVLSSQWFAASICDSGTCTTNATVPTGVATWRVQTYGIAGLGQWSVARNLSLLQ